MKAVMDKKNEKVTIRAECRDEEGRKHLEKVELKTRDADTVKYVEKKLADKGVGRLDRHPADGLAKAAGEGVARIEVDPQLKVA
ncbi:Unknown protein [Striga hermonthica]|uniref:Uncharacterized protein n=1 Tax=Striga hermonthica TaxID=68872 RepID=A0A9N7NHY6_STRHE|nr:Unknown protein [Striga hermonthica]